MEHCEKTFGMYLDPKNFWWPGQTPQCIRVWQETLHYDQVGTNLRKEPNSPLLTLVQQFSEVEQCLLHTLLLQFLQWKDLGMNVFPLCGVKHITQMNRKQAHQQCGNSFFLLAFWTPNITKPCPPPQNGEFGRPIIPAPSCSKTGGEGTCAISAWWIGFLC